MLRLLTRLTCRRCACLRRYLPSSTQLWCLLAVPACGACLRCLLAVPACGACLRCLLTGVPGYGGACLRYLPVAPAYGGACLRWYLSAPACSTCLSYMLACCTSSLLACGTCLGACLWCSPAWVCLQYLLVSACVCLCLLEVSLYVYLLAVPACGNRLPQPRALVLPAYGTYLLSLPGSNTCLPCLPCLLAVPLCLLAVRVPALAFIACALCLLAVHLPVVPLLREACLLYCVCGAWLLAIRACDA